MRIRITKAPKKGFYIVKGEYAWFYGLNLWFFHTCIFPGHVNFEWAADGNLRRIRVFEWRLK